MSSRSTVPAEAARAVISLGAALVGSGVGLITLSAAMRVPAEAIAETIVPGAMLMGLGFIWHLAADRK